jgi:hypothetical protein
VSYSSLLPVNTAVSWEHYAVLAAPLGASTLGVVATVCNWIGRRRLRKWARQVRQLQAQATAEDKAEKRTHGASVLLVAPATAQNVPDYMNVLQQLHILPGILTTVVVVSAVTVTVVNDGPRVPQATFTATAVQDCRIPLESIYQDASTARDDAGNDASSASQFINLRRGDPLP